MKSYRVLVADDDAAIRKRIEKVCVELGWEVDTAASGQEALETLKNGPHQIFVIDIKMPGPSGIDLARVIMKQEEAPAILILTGYAELEKAVQSMKEGIFDYLQKDSVDLFQMQRILKHAAEYHESLLWSRRIRREREKAFRDIDEANKKFQSIVELSRDLIFILDARTGQIEDCNATVYDCLGYSREELLRLPFARLADGQLVPSALAESSTLFELTLQDKEGNSFPVEISSSRVGLESGEYLILIARDITDRKRLENERQQIHERIHRTLTQTINMVASLVEKRDPYTAGHQKRVSELSVGIAKGLGMDEYQIEGIRLGGLIHDIGKIYVPGEILSKPGRLNEIEFNMIKLHTQVGGDIVREVDYPWPITQIVSQHHERLDGSGYHQGLTAESISIEAKIIAVADVVEAMASHRPYRPALGIEAALTEIREKKRIWFEPEIVDICVYEIQTKGFP